MAKLSDIRREIARCARAQGFTLVGFAAVRRLVDREDFFRKWLSDGNHGSMGYLARAPGRRFDPRRLDDRYRTVVSLGHPYLAPAAPDIDWRREMRGRIAAYAFGPDYHDVVLRKARAVAATITEHRIGAVARCYVDTGPVFEREWAAQARIGWFGKNTMTLDRNAGSYFFLAEIFTDLELEPSDAPYREHCGTCTRCLDLCPTGALVGGYKMDARVCISYLTIENRSAIPPELRSRIGNWIFGCDICQEVCPWNSPLKDSAPSDLTPFLPDLMALDDAAFSRRFSKSAIKRAKRRGLLRNAAVALGNTRNPDAIPTLRRAMESEPEPLVRSHAAWALGEIGGTPARRILERALGDPDADVKSEASAALETFA